MATVPGDGKGAHSGDGHRDKGDRPSMEPHASGPRRRAVGPAR
jgi:hypothetical protein